jgi:hypothetical protein
MTKNSGNDRDYTLASVAVAVIVLTGGIFGAFMLGIAAFTLII